MKKIIQVFFQIFVVFFFLSATTYALLAAYGYQIDLLEKNIVKTSIIDVSSTLEDVSIILDGEVKAKSAPFQIKNIEPGLHNLKIEKEGFTTWKRSIEVPENVVAKVHDVILIADNFGELTLDMPLDFIYTDVLYHDNSLLFISAAENKIHLYRLNSQGSFDIENINLKMNDNKYDRIYFAGNNHVAFSNSQTVLLLNLEDKQTQTIIIPNEFDDFQLIFAPDLKGFYHNEDNLYVANVADDGAFNKITLLYESLIEDEDNGMEIIDSQGNILVLEGDYLFHFVEDQLFYIDSNIKSIPDVSPNGVSVAYIRNAGEIMTYDFYDHSKELLARFASSINTIKWYEDGEHLYIDKYENLEFCDLSFENCSDLLSLDEKSVFINFPNQQFFTIVNKEAISLSFLVSSI